MNGDTMVFTIFIIFAGAALLSTLALYTRQSLLVAYLLLGALIGPWGFRFINDPTMVSQAGDIGILFLLFLLGLHLQPQNLFNMLREVTPIALVSSVVFAAAGIGIGLLFGYTWSESIIIGVAMMFSSTIIGLKLLPTTILHHQHTGEVMISVLLMQDLIAIAVLLGIQVASDGGLAWYQIGLVVLSVPILLVVAYLVQRYVLIKLITRFDKIREYIFLISIAWCLSMTELARVMGLSEEIGAFIAGISIAASPISLYIAESLKPLRDFFLVIFFFSIGASFNLRYVPSVIIPAAILAVIMLVFKPILFRFLLTRSGENKAVAWEVGVRLGQASEFSLLVAYLALGTALIGKSASFLIQAATIITFIASSYLVVMRYPTPVAISDRLRRD